MFNVGDIVTGTSDNPYGITNSDALLEVVEIISDFRMKVKILGCPNPNDLGEMLPVTNTVFKLITPEEFIAEHPYHYYVKDLNDIKSNIKEDSKMETRMNKNSNYEMTNEERAELRQEIIDLLVEYDYNPTDYGVDAGIDKWVKNKGWMVNMFKKHPNYNGKYQIAFDVDFSRRVDRETIGNFTYYLNYTVKPTVLVEQKLGCFTYYELVKIIDRLEDVGRGFRYLKSLGYNAVANGKTSEEIEFELEEWKQRLTNFKENDSFVISGGKAYNKESWHKSKVIGKLADIIYDNNDSIATDDFAEKINELIPEAKAVSGQKFSRIINKVCGLLGINKHPDYNREFAKYSDAINPLHIKRHTILSCHPVDYLTMSFGNSWASCHTIDKQNKRRRGGEHYSGCYSGGTMSYMLDDSSFVFYTVDSKYDGDKYELQDKINRNMFHIGEDKLIQGRVYPQAMDGEDGLYKQIREIVQKVIADCMDMPNMWKNVKGTSECSRNIISNGVHYKDYLSFEYCNVSYLKGDTDEVNLNKIIVGHDPICPYCGEEHTNAECIECEDCYNDEKRCAGCGDWHDPDDMWLIDGEYYCCDCCFYCEYHNEREIGDYVDVNNYGYVCEDALDYCDEFYQCERCGGWYWTESSYDRHIVTEDGRHYCCGSCAHRDGYEKTSDDEWYPSDEVYRCETCGRLVHEDDWNDDCECCNDCAEEAAEEEVELEERGA